MTARRKTAVVSALAAILLLALGLAWRTHSTALERPLRLDIVVKGDASEGADPLVVDGRAGAGDFLCLKRVDSSQAVFSYDSWGTGGPSSKPVSLEPGVVHHLVIEMPGLTQLAGTPEARSKALRVTCDGATVLEGDVSSYLPEPDQVYIGWNPLGGTSCGTQFRGGINRTDGRLLRGGTGDVFARRLLIVEWWSAGYWRILLLVLLSFTAIYGIERLFRPAPAPRQAAWTGRLTWLRRHATFLAAAALGIVGFSYFITDGTFTFDYPESFGAFYDYQASSFLDGRWDVPVEAVPNEGFIARGKTYGYFGPAPALERIPFALIGVGFGRLSRLLMLADFIGCLVFSYLILGQAVRLFRPGQSGPSRRAVLLLILNVGLGSTLLFLGARAYTYHEAILSGAAWALAGGYFTLRYLSEPGRRGWLAAWGCGLMCVHSRPSTGLFALCFTGCVGLYHALRSRRSDPKTALRHVGIGVLCAAGILSFNAVSFIKFRTFDGAPLRLSVQYDAKRLARIDGKNFHVSNLPANLDGYVWGTHFTLESHFPYFFADRPSRADFPGSKLDLIEKIVAMPFSVSGLFVLAVAGSAFVLVRRAAFRTPVALLWISATPFILAMLTAVAMSQRYTADFCPFLIVAASLSLAAMEGSEISAGVRAFLTLATLWAIFVTAALAWHFQGAEVWGVPESALEHYRSLCLRADGFFHHVFH